jgi:hypothetical protein
MADGGDAGAAASGGDGAAGGVGDTPKKEPKGRLSFLTKLNPFAKESEKEKEEKRAATEQKNKELAEAKKKRDDIEKEKGNREEAKESSRLAAKREKYQRLLQKNPDTTKRVFQFRMKAIKLEALTQERLSSYLRIMVGGDYTEREVPGIWVSSDDGAGQHASAHHGASTFHRCPARVSSRAERRKGRSSRRPPVRAST